MSKPTGYIVRPKDMKALQRELNRVRSNTGDLWVAARTLVGWAEPIDSLPLDEPVNVPADPDVEPQPYDMPSPEADALDRIAELVAQAHTDSTDTRVTWGAYVALADYVTEVLRSTGRL